MLRGGANSFISFTTQQRFLFVIEILILFFLLVSIHHHRKIAAEHSLV